MKKIIVKGVQPDKLKDVKQIVDDLNLGKYNLKLSIQGVIEFEFVDVDTETWGDINVLVDNTELVKYSVEIVDK